MVSHRSRRDTDVPPNLSTIQRSRCVIAAVTRNPVECAACPLRRAPPHSSRSLPMPARRYLQLDVFADRPGAGNPLGVVLDGAGLDDGAMQAIARWTRLPETTFVLPATRGDASYRLRIFSPRHEVPFAGHPSVGTAHAVLEAGLAVPRDAQLVQEGAAGLLPLRVRGHGRERTIAVRTPRASVVEVAGADDARLRAALPGIPRGALPPVLMDGGRRWWLVEVAQEAALRSAEPDWNAVARLASDTGSMGVCVFARSDDPVYHLAVRAFVGAPA